MSKEERGHGRHVVAVVLAVVCFVLIVFAVGILVTIVDGTYPYH